MAWWCALFAAHLSTTVVNGTAYLPNVSEGGEQVDVTGKSRSLHNDTDKVADEVRGEHATAARHLSTEPTICKRR